MWLSEQIVLISNAHPVIAVAVLIFCVVAVAFLISVYGPEI